MALPRPKLRTLHIFAGAGGGILADILLGHVPVCAVELEEYPRNVLLARQRDGCLPWFPIWDDVKTFDGRPWRGRADVVCGGFPCQDISAAGRGAGIGGERSGLWTEMARIVGEVQPGFVFVENSPMLTSRGLGTVLGDLAALGYDARWGVLGAWNTGAPHGRERIWIVADSDRDGLIREPGKSEMERTSGVRERDKKKYRPKSVLDSPWPPRPCRVSDIPRMVDELADGVDRNKAIGNGQDCRVAALAWRILSRESG